MIGGVALSLKFALSYLAGQLTPYACLRTCSRSSPGWLPMSPSAKRVSFGLWHAVYQVCAVPDFNIRLPAPPLSRDPGLGGPL